MRGIPFNNLEGSNKFGVISSSTAAAEAEISSLSQFYWKTQEEEIIRAGNSCFFGEVEPTSVLDTRRSPGSSTSTLSASSFGGGGGGRGRVLVVGGFGGGSTDRASVAAVSDNNPLQKWPTTTTITNQEENSTPAATPDVSADIPASSGSSSGGGGGGSRKDEWGSELQPISSNHHEIVSSGGSGGGGVGIGTVISGGEKYGGGGGLAMEDWNDMLSENEASPSLLRWIIDDAEDPTSSAALLQGGGGVSHLHNASSNHHHQHSVGTYNAGFGIVDPTTAAAAGFGFESIGGGGGGFTNLLGGGGVPGSGFSSGRMNFNNSIQQQQQQQNPSANFNTTKISSSPCFNNTGNTTNPFTVSPNHNLLPPPGVFYHNNNQQFEDEKPQLYNPQIMMMNQNQQLKNSSTPPFFVPLPSYQQDQSGCFPPLKRHQGMGGNPSSNCHSMEKNSSFMDSGQEQFLRKQQQQQQQQQQQNGFPHQLHLLPNHLQQRPPPVMLTKPKLDEHQNQQHNQQQQQQQQQQALVDQLFKAAELVESGNSVLAQGILARLNHQLSHPIGKPLYRAAFYFKEALLQLLSAPNSPPLKNFSPIDVVMKIGAYKSFSEISPLLQFSNFTLNQALLESLDGFDHIHIIDFDIGIGGQWASFMQEIAVKMGGAPSLKISAFASFSSNDHHKLELALTKEHLTHFANDLGISFEIDIVDLDTLDPSSWSLPIHVSEKETVAVNLPVGSSCINPSSIPALLRLVKQLSPKIVVSVDRGCDRSDLPFSHHFLQALQANSILFDSLDATNTNSETINKIERFLVQPRIESTVFQRHLCHEKLPPWRTLFASAGFSPVTFSNFTETQAECLLKRLQGRGFHVEKRQASLVLCWQRRELVSASAWRC
ncbi:hypothetical protein MKW98_019410 [Papaver atlanticum]|uniref:Scarecrow-like protein 6 n=1 Tax=Papaver atlanticum TaxID=357466 RepID=A0AAD4XBC3_9MAGN|nr:hypothetical protein MKW98_019410 [Papaver atlanticum]